jgi:hypothetical protein
LGEKKKTGYFVSGLGAGGGVEVVAQGDEADASMALQPEHRLVAGDDDIRPFGRVPDTDFLAVSSDT